MIKGHFERKTGVLLFYVEIFHTRSFVLFSIINCVSDVGAVACPCPFISDNHKGLPLHTHIRKSTSKSDSQT